MKQCIKCNIELIVESNWSICRREHSQYICKNCMAEYRAAYYNKNKKHVKEIQQAYVKTSVGKEARNRASRKHNRTEKGKITKDKYAQSERGKFENLRRCAKRRRNLGFIKIQDNIFPKNIHIHWHHIDSEHVIALPRDVHRKCFTGETVRHRELCFQAIECLYGESIKK